MRVSEDSVLALHGRQRRQRRHGTTTTTSIC